MLPRNNQLITLLENNIIFSEKIFVARVWFLCKDLFLMSALFRMFVFIVIVYTAVLVVC